MGNVDLRKLGSPADLAQAAARDWLAFLLGEDFKRPLSVALSGGRIAGEFFLKIAQHADAKKLGSVDVHFFWSDERGVPPGDPQSNFRLADDSLLKPLNIPPSRIHRIQGEKPPADACAIAGSELRRVAPAAQGGPPLIDLILLGMGEDGHVASLFPGESETAMSDPALFRDVTAVKPPPLRITMGYGLIAQARQVWVLASGAGKQAALRESLSAASTPLGRVIRQRADTRIYSDLAV